MNRRSACKKLHCPRQCCTVQSNFWASSGMRPSTMLKSRYKRKACNGKYKFKNGCRIWMQPRSEEHTSELQSRGHLVCRLLLEKKNDIKQLIKSPRRETDKLRLYNDHSH